MKARRTTILWIAVILAIGIALPAVAQSRTTGDQLRLLGPGFCPTSAYPADMAFHVAQGFGFDPELETNEDLGQWLFHMEVDGNPLPLSNIRITEVRDSAPEGFWLAKAFVYNFPDGLSADEHTLTGIWTNPDGDVILDLDCDIEFLD